MMAAADQLPVRLMPASCYPVRVDWARCMRELREFGWTPYRVALHFGAEPQTAYGWEKGRREQGNEPGASYGAALLALHRFVCGEEYSAKLMKDARPR